MNQVKKKGDPGRTHATIQQRDVGVRCLDLFQECLRARTIISTPDECQEDKSDKNKNWYQHVVSQERLVLAGLVLVVTVDFSGLALVRATICPVVNTNVSLGDEHGTEVALGEDEEEHQDDHEDRIVTILNGLEEDSECGVGDGQWLPSFFRSSNNFVQLILDEPDFVSNPRRNTVVCLFLRRRIMERRLVRPKKL